MKKLLISINLTLVGFCVNAQDKSLPKDSWNQVYFSLGVQYLNPANLNQLMTDNSLSIISPYNSLVAIGTEVYKGKVGFNVEGGISSSFNKFNESRLTSLKGLIGINYLFFQRKHILLGLNLNYNYKTINSYVYTKDESNLISAQNLQSSNGGIIYLNNQTNNIGISVFANLLYDQRETTVKLGYDYQIGENRWKVANSGVQDFPFEKFQSLYFQVNISIFKNRRGLEK